MVFIAYSLLIKMYQLRGYLAFNSMRW